jgi:hypothetical protein
MDTTPTLSTLPPLSVSEGLDSFIVTDDVNAASDLVERLTTEGDLELLREELINYVRISAFRVHRLQLQVFYLQAKNGNLKDTVRGLSAAHLRTKHHNKQLRNRINQIKGALNVNRSDRRPQSLISGDKPVSANKAAR